MARIEPAQLAAWTFPADQTLTELEIGELEQLCPYCWAVETVYSNGGILVSFLGSVKGRKGYSYDHSLNPSANHLRAAVLWLQGLSDCNGAHSYRLVCRNSTAKGHLFVFT